MVMSNCVWLRISTKEPPLGRIKPTHDSMSQGKNSNQQATKSHNITLQAN